MDDRQFDLAYDFLDQAFELAGDGRYAKALGVACKAYNAIEKANSLGVPCSYGPR